MLLDVLKEIYERDLAKVGEEILLYADEADLWKLADGISNTGGNLALHIAGNLQHFFGAVLEGTDYVRNRDAEFADKQIPRDELLAKIDAARTAVSQVLSNLDDEKLAANYPIEVFGQPMTTEFFIIHLATHLNYHLGQINYHRRILTAS